MVTLEASPQVLDDETALPPATIKLSKFLAQHQDEIAQRVIEQYPPHYQPTVHGARPLPPLQRQPLGAQNHAIQATALSLELNRATNLVGEMGCGKTLIAIAAAVAAKCRNILVLCPPHLVEKWQREVIDTLGPVHTGHITSITGLKQALQRRRQRRALDPDTPSFLALSRQTAKLSYRWQPVYLERPVSYGRQAPRRQDNDDLLTMRCCIDCGAELLDEREEPIPLARLSRRKMYCLQCGGALWGPQPGVKGPYPLASYIRRYHGADFDLLIADEIHEYKDGASAQGIAAGNLAETCPRTLTLTGTLMGGYSSNLFHLLYRFHPPIRDAYKHGDLQRWINHYGYQEFTTNHRSETLGHGRASVKRISQPPPKERPGLAPTALLHVLDHSIFLKLQDISASLPEYREHIALVSMSNASADHDTSADPDRPWLLDPQAPADPADPVYQPQPGVELPSQRSNYRFLNETLSELIRSQLYTRDGRRMLSTYLQTLLSYPDGCTRGEMVVDPRDGSYITHVPPLTAADTYPKEQALLDLVQRHRARGRRVLVYVTHTNRRDMIPRLEQLLTRNQLRCAALRSNSPSSLKRESWIMNRVREGLDVLICNPSLVETGLDLIDFPTIIWYETSYSTYTTRQASRRSWRIGQTQPVDVYFLAYRNTMQARALELVGQKLQASLAVEGELPEEGLAQQLADQADNLLLTLAKDLVNNVSLNDQDTIEAIFANNLQAVQQDNALLTPDDWTVPNQPAPIIPATMPAPLLIPEPASPPPSPDLLLSTWEAAFGIDLSGQPPASRRRR